MDEKNFKKLIDDTQNYLVNQADILKLDFANKLAKLLGYVAMGFVVLLAVMVLLIFVGIALAQLLANFIPAWIAYILIVLLYVICIWTMISHSTTLVIRPLTKGISTILFGGEVYGGIEREMDRLKSETEKNRLDIDSDIDAIQKDIAQPTTAFAILKNLPTIFGVASTVYPIIKKMIRK